MSAPEHVTELIPAYVLGALDDEELVYVSEHLAHCAECQEELRASRAVIDGLLLSTQPADPPAASRARLLTHIHQLRHKEEFAEDMPAAWWQRFVPTRKWMAVLQPLMLALVIGLVVSNLLLYQQVQMISSLTPSRNVVQDPRVIRLRGTDLAPDARGAIILTVDGYEGTLVVEGLPPLEGAEYQLWLKRQDRQTTAGYFSVADEGRNTIQVSAPEPFFNYDDFDITVEPLGGSDEPTGEEVMDGFLDLLEMLDVFDD